MRGHRVSLFLILEAHYDGLTVEEIHDRYPTISMENLREIVDFTRDFEESMRQFFDDALRQAKENEHLIKHLPSLAKLRSRQARKQ